MDNDRNFGFSNIKWTIEHFFAATCTNKWLFRSPTFTVSMGKTYTKWRIFLKSSNDEEENIVSICLVRKDTDSLQEPIWINWKLLFPCDIGERPHEAQSCIKNKRSIKIDVINSGELENIMQKKTNDSLVINCTIFVYLKDSQVYKKSEDSGLKSLSQDMTTLYRVDENYDAELLIGDSSINFHKGILWCRNDVLKTAIEKSESVVILPKLDKEAVISTFGYLYTGNLDHVLRRPSLPILKCLKDLRIEEIEKYYKPDELNLCTDFKVKEYKFHCIIPAEIISDFDIVICSPDVQKDMSSHEGVSPLDFYFTNETENSDYITIFIDNVKENFSKFSYVEIAFKNSDDCTSYFQRRRCSDFTSEIAFENILPRKLLEDASFTLDGNLYILCNFCIPIMGSKVLTADRKILYSGITIDPERHYRTLSEQLTTLFETGIYSDMTLHCNGENFRVHSYILSARSQFFREILDKKRKNLDTSLNADFVEISNVKSEILKTVLYYIYSGKLVHCEMDEVLEIYEAAENFHILPLKYQCSTILQSNVESLDESVLHLAKQFKDYKLISSIENFIN